MKDIKEIVKIAYKAMDDKKAEDIKIIYIGDISVMADYFIIGSGHSISQLNAITDNVNDELAKEGVFSTKVEGNRNATWILMDYKDVVVHIFSREDRDFYNLERIWKDGKFLSIDEL
ncbi:MAG: ribosome silencing factor [Lachnospiraceae bacterium]|nr:ribosome silencing factor [Lachnospiraceae bacterium]